MKKRSFFIALVLLLALPAHAYETRTTADGRQVQVGIDYELPYIVDSDAGSDNRRGASLLGIHGDYFVNPNWSVGMQFDFGLEDRGFSDTPLFLTPGTSWYFRPGETWDPYFRFDLPILLNSGQDFGISGGLGLLWNIGDYFDNPGLGLKYDFDVNYLFDAKVTSLNLMRFGFVYTW